MRDRNRATFSYRLALLLLPITGIWVFVADAKPPDNGSSHQITTQILDAKIKEIDAEPEFDEAAKTKLIGQYRRTLSYLEATRSHNSAAVGFSRALETASSQAKDIRRQLEVARRDEPEVTTAVSAQTPLIEIEQKLLKEEANLVAVETKRAELEKQLAIEAERPSEVQRRLTEAKSLQTKLTDELKLPPAEDESATFTEARRWLLQAQVGALSSEIQMLDRELLSQPMRFDLLKARRDQIAHNEERIFARVRLLTEELNRRRRTSAEQAQMEAAASQREAEGKHPQVRQLAQQNALLSEQLGAMATALEQMVIDRDRAVDETKRIEENARSTRQKLEIAGLSHALGQVLLEQRRSLPDSKVLRRQARQRARDAAEAGLRQIRHSEERKRLLDARAYVSAFSDDLAPAVAARIRHELEQLAVNRRTLLDQTIEMDRANLRALGELDFVYRRLLQSVESYHDFLARRLLWMRSGPMINRKMLRVGPQQLAQLLSPQPWRAVLRDLVAPRAQWPLLAMGLAVFAILLAKTRNLRDALYATGDHIGKPSVDRFSNTGRALLLSLLIAAPWPLLLALLAWPLRMAPPASTFSIIVADALVIVARAFFVLRALQVMCARDGLADAHFRWPQTSLENLRRELNPLMWVFLPAVFVALVVVNTSEPALGGGLGRLVFLTMLLALAVFCFRLLASERGALHAMIARHPSGWLARLRWLWLTLSIFIPLSLAVLALLGYTYTAGTLTHQLVHTLWFALALLIVQQLATRWLLVARRRLALKAALERREAARVAKQEKASSAAGGDEAALSAEEPKIDLVCLSQESRELLNTALAIVGILGVGLIWSGVLPALSILKEFTLWYVEKSLAGEVKRLPVTLQDLVTALLIGVAALVVTRRLPAFLEIALLPHFELSSGSRYTITTLTNYFIVALGVVLIFSTLGGSWSNIQWLVAALSVGIGFGLQEIVANFISGLIILFERPIRVGDIVTIGDNEGVVTNIHIRATTIRDWDQKELLVPNKEFITGRLLNWTLSDQMSRIFFSVGIAYGSDVPKAMALIAEAAQQHHKVLPDPAPFVTFEGFGDNALILRLRCYLDGMEHRLSTISELHQSINEKFVAANVVIAFPQLDVHLDVNRRQK